jgi:pyruvate/2-oxoglutarate dehydrogenase complex dihydrolipoamide dehydrogenase (E3) component
MTVEPMDEHNAALVANVHPPDWQNPTPAAIYDLVVIGAGSGGLITSLVASSLGARVALVERHLLGGDCLNVGCVPSKAVIRAAHLAHEARAVRSLGMQVGDAAPDFGRAMERMRRIRARISHEDSAERYSKEFGVDVYFGHAELHGPRRVRIDRAELRYAKAVIATGARASAPPIPGLAEAGYLDNESVFTLTERPERIALLGAGPIGCELAQAFRRLGSQVTIYEIADQILTREDADAARIVQGALVRDGIDLVLGAKLERVDAKNGERHLHVTCPARGTRVDVVDQILVGAGRAPNVLGMGLETVGVEFDPRTGIRVDDFLRTTNPRIYAVGDVCMQWKFTHAADAAAKIVVQNALIALGPLGRRRLSQLVMPWCTYTDPEIAHVGLYERDAKEKGIAVDTVEVPMARANRALTDGQEEGFVKVHLRKGTDKILGATIVASHAGDLITQITLAMHHGIGLGAFSNVIYPYPTQGEAIKACAGLYTRTRLTPLAKRVIGTLMGARRALDHRANP